LPESSGYRLIQTLEELGAIARDGRGRYRPSLLLAALSRQLTIGEIVCEASVGVIEPLAARLSVTVHAGVLEEGMVTYVAKASAEHAVQTPTIVGSQLEPYCSGLGKVLLAALPKQQLKAFLSEGEFVPLTERTITDPGMLRREIDKVRRTDFAVDDQEVCVGLRCVAVPIRDLSGRTIGALSASDRADRVTPARVELTRKLLRESAAAIGAKLHPRIMDRARIPAPLACMRLPNERVGPPPPRVAAGNRVGARL
jgi:IclR family acetate operon transcriptional repressor